MPQAQLVQFSYTAGSDYLTVQAIVEDAIQVAPATRFDPPEFGSALCEAVVLWDDPITADNAPTRDEVLRMLPWIDDWCVVPPLFSGYDD